MLDITARRDLMPWDFVAFMLLSTICVITAGGMVASNNPVHAGVFLGLCFIHVAGIFVMLGAEFLAVIQVIVYTGAILVLLLFVLMLVDPDDLPEFHTARPVQRIVAVLLGAVLLLEIGVAILGRTIQGQEGTHTAANIEAVGGNTEALGRTLYTDFLLPFEVASLVLTVGVIGAIVLALPERLGLRATARRRGTISLGHARGVDAALPEGVRGETPIEVVEGERAVAGRPGRGLIMVSDPDEYTTIGRKR
jgi:NADH-quinone oxidoreductase subunit J